MNLQNKKNILTLGIETSCDDTSVSLVQEDGFVIASEKWTQDEDHVPFGGIIPERASRNHLKNLIPLIEKLLTKASVAPSDLAAIAVTNRPGLQGSLIVGVITAQTLSAAWGVPVVGVNHLEGHMLSPWLVDELKDRKSELNIYPQISLIVSGGHTQLVYMKEFGVYKVLGRTKDDAAGEAIDKFSNVIGLGFPGGPKVDEKSQLGNDSAYNFPRPMMKEPNYDFSFSGLKASGARMVEKIKEEAGSKGADLTKKQIEDLSASYLKSAVDVLIYKLQKSLAEYKPKLFTIVGGVSANTLLRKRAERLSVESGLPFFVSLKKYCTDNGAMIALAGAQRVCAGLAVEAANGETLKTSARSLPEDFQ